jgi:hypothetical protein
MRRRWYILAALAGALAAAAVWGWPVSPLWRSGPDVGRLEGFSPDGRTLVTARVPPEDSCFPNPEVCRWDANTGKLLGRVQMPCAEPAAGNLVTPSADGRRVLVGERMSSDINSTFITGDWYLHDGITGQRKAGPIPGVTLVDHNAFSPDARWFVGIRGQLRNCFRERAGIDIFSADTGDLVLALPDRDGLVAGECFFAPDSATVAVDWWPQDWKCEVPTKHTVQVFKLSSGHERYRFELPPRPWLRINKWDGRCLEAIRLEGFVRGTDGPPGYFVGRSCGFDRDAVITLQGGAAPGYSIGCSFVFDLSQDPVGDGVEDPLLREFIGAPVSLVWKDGPGWVAYFCILPSPRQSTGFTVWRDWFAAKVGVSPSVDQVMKIKARFVDRGTGAVRYELPYIVGYECDVRRDGRRLACPTDDGRVEVWDTDPPPRWPATLAVGAVAAGGVLALGRWRCRRSKATQFP